MSFSTTPSLACLLFVISGIGAHVSNGQTASTADPAAVEVATTDEPATFQSRVNLVSIPVVVRDASGKVVQSLNKEDFRLFDRGKLQVISKFVVEKPGQPAPVAADDLDLERAAGAQPAEQPAPGIIPQHFTAYVFDDVHLAFNDLAAVRAAAIKHLDANLSPADRAAIFTTSGQTILDFTDDHAKLRETLLRLHPSPIAAIPSSSECPNINYFMADAIENKNDQLALQIETAEAMACYHLTTQAPAQQLAEAAARRVLTTSDHETRVSLSVLLTVIQRLSVLPGQRSILLASPGFFVPDDIRFDENQVMQKAVHANVVLSSLDARGLYTIDPLGDISQKAVSAAVSSQKTSYEYQNATAAADILAELALGTGGSFFQNNNDLVAGFKKLAETPETIYILWFTPQALKLDGAFHQVKIKVTAPGKLDVQARRGYFAPKHLQSADDTAKEEIREQVFSREELHSGAVDLHTQFFKVSDTDTTLSVVAHVILKQIAYQKIEGRNKNDLTVVAALFDRNGNFVKAVEKTVSLRLRDETLSKIPRITIKTDFDVPPGGYAIRLVVRDRNGQMMATENSAVEIPY